MASLKDEDLIYYAKLACVYQEVLQMRGWTRDGMLCTFIWFKMAVIMILFRDRPIQKSSMEVHGYKADPLLLLFFIIVSEAVMGMFLLLLPSSSPSLLINPPPLPQATASPPLPDPGPSSSGHRDEGQRGRPPCCRSSLLLLSPVPDPADCLPV